MTPLRISLLCGVCGILCMPGAVSSVTGPALEIPSNDSGIEPVAIQSSVQSEPLSHSRLDQANTLHEEALTLLFRGQYDEALPIAQQSLDLRTQELGANHALVASSLTLIGQILYQQLELDDAKAILERALTLRETLLGNGHVEVARDRVNLARVLSSTGQYGNAEHLLTQALTVFNEDQQSYVIDTGRCLTHLAIVYIHMGDLQAARRNIAQAVKLFEQEKLSSDAQRAHFAMALNVFGTVLGREGEYIEARRVLEQSLELREKILGLKHVHTGRTLIGLGQLVSKLGFLDLALGFFERALTITESSLGSKNAEMSGILNEVGRIHRLKGNLKKAQSYFERALMIQKTTIGEAHPFVAGTLNELALVHQERGEYKQAKSFYEKALNIQKASLGPNHLSVAETLTNVGYLEGRQGRVDKAAQDFTRALNIRRKTLGRDHPDVASSLIDVARAYHGKQDFARAGRLYEDARESYVELAKKRIDYDDHTLGRIWRRQLAGLRHYLLLLDSLSLTIAEETERDSFIEDSFLVAEQARGWMVQTAVARALAKRRLTSTRDVSLASKIDQAKRERQDLWNKINHMLSDLQGKPKEMELEELRREVTRQEDELDRMIALLRTQAPRYSEMAMPRPVDLKSVKNLLRDGEALISFYVLDDRILVWLIRPDAVEVYRRVMVPKDRVENLVRRIRTSILPTFRLVRDSLVLPPIDVDGAMELYDLLLSPLAPYLKNETSLIVIPDAVLLPLPFGVLLTASDGENTQHLAHLHREGQTLSEKDVRQYAKLPWLAKRFPLTVLPSASALRLIRGDDLNTEKPKSTVAFMGFGDPLLKGTGQDRGGAMLAIRGLEVDRGELLALNRLPGTRQELLAMAMAMGVPHDGHVFLAEAATETSVRKLQASGRLGHARVLAFATHGLLAGELRGLSQPALVLTPPATSSEQDDGLLSMEEILQWHLPATEWVVLSACNTGASDGSEEGLSGLARAFFYAGAKTLLVSQWSVDDRATQHLMGEVFQRYGGDKILSPAVALQQGMLALMQHAGGADTAYFAHPYAWAPFFLVGAGQ